MRARWWSVAIAAALTSTVAQATTSELRELFIGTRARAMGGAFTAVADDEEALYMNPAGLAGIKGQQINYAILDGEASSDVITSSSLLSSISSPSGAAINQLMGKNIYARGQIAPSFVMPSFGVGILLDGQTAVLANNTALPDIVAGYQQTMGIQAGMGFAVNGQKRRRRSAKDSDLGAPELRIGLGAKMFWRRGGYRTLALSQLINIDENTLKGMAGNYGRGFGFDLGTQYLLPVNSRLTLSAGLAATEIGDMRFASTADTQKGNLSFGLAARYKLPKSEFIFAYDYRHILDDTVWQKRTHLGLEAKLPILSLYLGLSEMRLTYGASFDAWIFKITALSYTEEISSSFGTDPERRYALQVAMSFGL